MDHPFVNNNYIINEKTTFGEYSNPINSSQTNYGYSTTNEIPIEYYFNQPNVEIPIESYFNQPNVESTNNSNNNIYIPSSTEAFNSNNFSYDSSNKNVSKINKNNNYNNLLINPQYSNINYNFGDIPTVSNISNYEKEKPILKNKENNNYIYKYDNLKTNDFFNNDYNNINNLNINTNSNSTNTINTINYDKSKVNLNYLIDNNYYNNNSIGIYTGENSSNLISSTINNLDKINLNKNNPYSKNNNNLNTNYIPITNNLSKNITTKKNIISNNNIYSVNKSSINVKEKKIMNIIEESKGLNRLNSKYILNIIFNYIKDDNIKYKLFVHSNKFQKRLNLNINDYQEKSIKNSGIKLHNYLSGYYEKIFDSHDYYSNIFNRNRDNYPPYFKKEELKNQFLSDLKKLNIKYIKSYLINYFKKYKESKNNDSNLYLDIFCPFFDLLSSQEYFSELFTIPIIIKFIEEYKLENEYISIFDKLNKSRNDYSILFRFNKAKDIDFFKKYINLNKVRKLIIYEEESKQEEKNKHTEIIGITENGMPYFKGHRRIEGDPPEIIREKKINYLFNTITSVNNLYSNLLYLKISINGYNSKKINLIENINYFKSLKHLELEYFFFNDIFELKLNNLKVFKIFKCKGITFTDSCCFNLKELYIIKSDIGYQNNTLLKFPNLEKCKFYLYLKDNNIGNDIQRYNSTINFHSFNNLKVLNSEADDFLSLKNSSLENISVLSNDIGNSKEKEKKILEKIISMKSLKEVALSLKLLNDNDISMIQGENTFIEKFTIYWDKKISDCRIINLQKKFPNVNNFALITSPWNLFNPNLNIEKKLNCKIKELTLYGGFSDITIYCQPLENLVKLDLIMFMSDLNGIKKSLPFLNNNCHLIFKSLIYFRFRVKNINIEFLNNICDNLEKMPNLKHLELKCDTNVDNNFYNKLNKKISLLKLNHINIIIYNPPSLSLMHIRDKVINLINNDGIIIRK